MTCADKQPASRRPGCGRIGDDLIDGSESRLTLDREGLGDDSGHLVASMNWLTQSPTWPGMPPRSCLDHFSMSPTIAGATRWESSRSFRVVMSYGVIGRVGRSGSPAWRMLPESRRCLSPAQRSRKSDSRSACHGVPRSREGSEVWIPPVSLNRPASGESAVDLGCRLSRRPSATLDEIINRSPV